ncbi:uncharacterized protein LOC123315795 [Coccinella septempunctata]|uniref:uncharacterized protein LOC123315795 n=1 Tax=Coccinella septempunctata TaxID=41139 RepID=UPI001D05FDC7|nr:uncharacterized protein LOC123315795 [Coccinella septempunctata]
MLRSKVKKKLPALKFLGKVERRDINELFEPVKTLNFTEERAGEKDCCENKWLGKHGERFRKIYNENKKLIGKLTTDYKKALWEVKNESPGRKQKSIISETSDDLKRVLENSKKRQEDDDAPFQINDPIDITDYMGDKEIYEEQEDSATWVLLRAKCDEDASETSSEGFINIKSKEQDEMTRPSIDWEILNESMIKCRKWLEDL